MTTLNACFNVITPALTRPTDITVVAAEDCRVAATSAPRSTPITGTPVRDCSTFWSRAPAACCRPPPNSSIPYKKSPTPPKKAKRCTIINVSLSSSLIV